MYNAYSNSKFLAEVLIIFTHKGTILQQKSYELLLCWIDALFLASKKKMGRHALALQT